VRVAGYHNFSTPECGCAFLEASGRVKPKVPNRWVVVLDILRCRAIRLTLHLHEVGSRVTPRLAVEPDLARGPGRRHLFFVLVIKHRVGMDQSVELWCLHLPCEWVWDIESPVHRVVDISLCRVANGRLRFHLPCFPLTWFNFLSARAP